eukprot:s877_g7.t1
MILLLPGIAVKTLSEVFTTYQEDVRQRILKKFREFAWGAQCGRRNRVRNPPLQPFFWLQSHLNAVLGSDRTDQQKTPTTYLQRLHLAAALLGAARRETAMWRWISAILVASVAGANLGASQQDGILKLLTADSAHGATGATAASQGNASKTSKAKAKTTQMEDMVLLLAQQAKAAREASKNKGEDEEMEELIEQLRQELKMMQTEINEAANTSNAACQAAYDNLTVGCPVYQNDTLFLPEGAESRVK